MTDAPDDDEDRVRTCYRCRERVVLVHRTEDGLDHCPKCNAPYGEDPGPIDPADY